MDFPTVYQRLGFTSTALLVMLLVCILEFCFAERYGHGKGGVLMDGVGYIHCVQNFETLIAEKRINQKIGGKINRFVPSMLVHYGMRAVNADLTKKSQIYTAYIIHNAIWILIGTWLWGQIGRLKKLREKSKWAGLVLLFGSVQILKFSMGYLPIMTDTVAFVLGIALIYFHLHPLSRIRISGLLLVSLIGAFTWQTVQIYGYILLLFHHSPFIHQKNRFIRGLTLILPSTFFLVNFILLYQEGGIDIFNHGLISSFGQLPLYERGFWITVAFSIFYTFFFYKELYYQFSFQSLKPLFSFRMLGRIGIALGLHLLIGFIHQSISPANVIEPAQGIITSVVSSNSTFSWYSVIAKLGHFFFNAQAIHYPFEIAVSHAVFFGITYIIAFLFFPQIADHIRKQGLGIVIIFTVSFPILLNPQSRIHTPLVPFIVLCTVLFIDNKNWKIQHIFYLLLINLFASKFWHTFGESFGSVTEPNMDTVINFYMNLGTWANMRWHAINTLACTVTGLYFLIYRKELVRLPTTLEEQIWQKIKQKFWG